MLHQIGFVQALPIIGFLLFFVYLAILLYRERKKIASARTLPGIPWICLTLAIILLYILAISQVYASRPTYFFIVFSVTACFILFTLLLPIRLSNRDAYAIFSLTVLLQLCMTLSYTLSRGIVIGERTPAIHEIVTQSRWDPGTQMLNPYYQIFPIDVVLVAIISQVTSIDYTSTILHIAASAVVSLACILTLFKLVMSVKGDLREGILAMLIFATLPVLGPIGINPPHLSLLFLTLILYLLFRYVKSIELDVRVPTLAVLLTVVTVSVITHAIVPFTLIIMLISLYFIRLTGIARKEAWMKPLRMSLIIATLISLVRWIYTEASIILVAYGKGMVFGFLREIFGYELVTPGYIPLYQQKVPAYFAYGWATPIAMAAAFMFWEIGFKSRFKRSQKINIFTFFNMVGLCLVLTGFLATLVYPSPGIQQRLAVPALLLVIPTISRALGLASRKSILVTIILLGLVASSIPINLFNPSQASDTWELTFTSGGANMPDQLEASTLVHTLKNNTHIIGLSSLTYALSLQAYKEDIALHGLPSLKDVRNVIDALTNNGETSYEGLIVMQSHTLILTPSVDIIYNSGRNLIYRVR